MNLPSPFIIASTPEGTVARDRYSQVWMKGPSGMWHYVDPNRRVTDATLRMWDARIVYDPTADHTE